MKNEKLQIKIKKSFKKILKITFLLGTRELYLFFRNLYGLICHPFLTIKRIKKERDFSQGVLIFGLPGYFWFGTIVFLAILRFLIGIRGNLGWIAQTFLFLMTSFSGLFFLYLFYWLSKAFKNPNGGGN